MTLSATIRDHLVMRFAQRRIVVWHDPDSSYTNDLNAQLPSDATLVKVRNDEFAIKHRIFREEPERKFLIYRTGQIPEGTANWLLDIELASGVFTADRAALVQAELGLTASGTEGLAAQHPGFFGNTKLTSRLKPLLNPDDDLTTVLAKMCAVLLGQREHSFSELTRTLLNQQADDITTGLDAFAEHELTDFYWRGSQQIYGYEAEAPTIAGFVLWMFRQAQGGFDTAVSNTARNIEIDFSSFRDNRKSEQAMKILARQAESDLDYVDQVANLSFVELTKSDTFEAGEREVIRRLVEGILSQTISGREVADTIRARRRESVWYEDYETLYNALAAAAELIPAIRSARLNVSSFENGLTTYRDELFRIDQLYRQYTFAAQNAEFKQPLEMLTEQVENAYINDFLFKLGTNWQQQVDKVSQWRSPALASQTSFFDHYIAPVIRGGRKKAVVVISDAMRYEVAEELHSRILGENKFDAKIEAMLGMLPSYTQLGMASLLPHKTLAHSEKGDPVLVDGQRSDGTVNRAKILSTVAGTTIQAKDFLMMKPKERRDLYAAHQVLYIYHDTIDATGDNAKSEYRTFNAAAEAIDQLIDLIKKLANANATNIFVTADHGFLYQVNPLPKQFNLTVKPHGDEIAVQNRRYVLGRGLKNVDAFRKFLPEQLGLSSDLEVQIPNSIYRIVKQGAGFQFVHGGASLQEIVVPVISINKGRADTVEPVNVEIHPESDKITTGQVVVKLYQQSPVTDQRVARKLRAGLYFGEQLISNEIELYFDAEGTEGRDRFQTVRLLLSRDADAANNQTVEFRLMEPIGDTGEWKKYKSAPYVVKRAFTSDDGWDF